MADGRVNGSLNLSRALGDMEYKQSKELGPEEQVCWVNVQIYQGFSFYDRVVLLLGHPGE